MENGRDKKIKDRFEELIQTAAGFKMRTTDFGEDYLDSLAFSNAYEWSSNAKQLIKLVCGENSLYLLDFEKYYSEFPRRMGEFFPKCLGVFKAAKSDYEHGFMTDQKSIITKNLLGDTIEQARELFGANFTQAAAIVAGVAIESKLKNLCSGINIEVDKPSINNYNTALHKAGQITQPTFFEIMKWGSIRNAAAHGVWGEFTAPQVDEMIKGITGFLDNY